MAVSDESRDAPAAAPVPEPIASAAEIQRLVSSLTVQRTANGGLVIEAPPDTASILGALFSGMAQLLQAAAAPRAMGGDRVGGTDTVIERPQALLLE